MTWPMVSLNRVAAFINGDRGKNYPSKGDFIENGIPFINAGNIASDHSVDIGGLSYITEDHFHALNGGKVEKGDVIFCLRGSLGKFAIIHNDMNGAIASSLVIIRPNKLIELNYLKHYLSSVLCQREIKTYENGAAQPNLSAKDLKSFKIPLPPIEEQKRIAAILDKADAIRQKRQQAIALADQFLRSVFLDMFGDPVTNPKGWDKKPLGRVFKLSSGNGLTAKEMDADGRYTVYGGNGISGFHSEYMFEAPQLIIGRVGIYCGAIHITEPRAWVTDNALYVKEYLCKINIHYLAQLLEILNLNQFAGRAAQPLVSGSRIYPIEAILPPIKEQVKFEKIKKSFTNSFSKNLSSKAEIDVFFNTLSRYAFSGQL